MMGSSLYGADLSYILTRFRDLASAGLAGNRYMALIACVFKNVASPRFVCKVVLVGFEQKIVQLILY
jgi:hypothetical protein